MYAANRRQRPRVIGTKGLRISKEMRQACGLLVGGDKTQGHKTLFSSPEDPKNVTRAISLRDMQFSVQFDLSRAAPPKVKLNSSLISVRLRLTRPPPFYPSHFSCYLEELHDVYSDSSI